MEEEKKVFYSLKWKTIASLLSTLDAVIITQLKFPNFRRTLKQKLQLWSLLDVNTFFALLYFYAY